MLKRFFALFVAMLMLAGLCVPIYAVDPDADTCTCEEPWPENPEEYGNPYIIDNLQPLKNTNIISAYELPNTVFNNDDQTWKNNFLSNPENFS